MFCQLLGGGSQLGVFHGVFAFLDGSMVMQRQGGRHPSDVRLQHAKGVEAESRGLMRSFFLTKEVDSRLRVGRRRCCSGAKNTSGYLFCSGRDLFRSGRDSFSFRVFVFRRIISPGLQSCLAISQQTKRTPRSKPTLGHQSHCSSHNPNPHSPQSPSLTPATQGGATPAGRADRHMLAASHPLARSGKATSCT